VSSRLRQFLGLGLVELHPLVLLFVLSGSLIPKP
jgi:hypothetical protein